MTTELTVCRADQLQDGQTAVGVVNGKQVAVFRVGEALYAIDDQCPHMGASLAGGHVEELIVTCPWHYWRFRLTDGAWADNPRIKIGSYPVREVEGDVRLTVPEKCPPCSPSGGSPACGSPSGGSADRSPT